MLTPATRALRYFLVAILGLPATMVTYAQAPGAGTLAAAMKPNNNPNVMRALAAFKNGQPLICPYCQLPGIYLIGKTLTNANLTGANLTGADLRRAMLDGAILAGANLTNAKLDNAQLTSSANGPADLSRANLTGATFGTALLGGSNMQFAEMPGADFTGSDLSETILGPATKTGVVNGKKTSFRNAKLPQGLQTGENTADLSGVVWTGGLKGEKGTEDTEWACGNADLSHLGSRIYVSPQGQDSGTCGTSVAAACQTISQGIQRCGASGCGVLVAWDQYQQTATIALRNEVSVYGGCLPANQSSPSYFSVIGSPAGGEPAMSANQINTATVVQGFQLAGSAASSGNGAPSVALLVTNSSSLQIMDTEILGNTGGQGATGGNGGAGGGGGGGAGGNAGPSVNIALVGNAAVTGSAIAYYMGSSGAPGPGTPGASSGSNRCTGATGANGNSGLVANTHQY